MLDYTLAQIARAVHGELAAGSSDARVASAAIDSRACGAGTLFFALPGERVDGHDFVAGAAAAGASGAVVSKARPLDFPSDLPGEFGLIVVDDPARALAELAGWHVGRLAVSASAGLLKGVEAFRFILVPLFRPARSGL